MAIILQEEGLEHQTRLYATDFNEILLRQAKRGIFPLNRMKEYTRNYQEAGGKKSLADYYVAKYDRARLDPRLAKHMVFAQHNLVTDSSFNEFVVILCRNVMIYFNRDLQKRVHQLLYQSLAPFGVLGLGDKESTRFTSCEAGYEALDAQQKWYRKAR
jgi:chemotaxis protein methyltransferase CheR